MQDPREDWDLPEWSPDSFDLVRELQINPRLRQEDLAELALKATRLRLPKVRDAELVKYLHSCDYDVLAAEQCLHHYYKIRSSNPQIFQGRDPRLEHIRLQATLLDFVVLPRRTPDGCRIMLNALKNTDTTNYNFQDHMKLWLMMMDAILMTEPTLPGIYIIYDLEGGSIGHFWKFGMMVQKKIYNYLQNGLPLQVKCSVCLHTPSYINTVMRVLRTLCDRKRLDETKLLTDDYSELHKIIPRECLPSDYGGTLPSRQELHDSTMQRLENLRDIFSEEDAAIFKA